MNEMRQRHYPALEGVVRLAMPVIVTGGLLGLGWGIYDFARWTGWGAWWFAIGGSSVLTGLWLWLDR